MSVSLDANHCLLRGSETKLSVHLILRSDAQHRVSKDGPGRTSIAPWSVLRDAALRTAPQQPCFSQFSTTGLGEREC